MTKICDVTARLSLVPAKKIRLREIPSFLARLLQKRLVSQFVKVIFATVKRPFGLRVMVVAISSTRKSATRDLSTPPIPLPSAA